MAPSNPYPSNRIEMKYGDVLNGLGAILASEFVPTDKVVHPHCPPKRIYLLPTPEEAMCRVGISYLTQILNGSISKGWSTIDDQWPTPNPLPGMTFRNGALIPTEEY